MLLHDSAQVAFVEGMGLVSMEERVERLGGTLEITSSPGEGTTVRVTLEVTG